MLYTAAEISKKNKVKLNRVISIISDKKRNIVPAKYKQGKYGIIGLYDKNQIKSIELILNKVRLVDNKRSEIFEVYRE